MAKRSSSLGPFAKTELWRRIVARALGAADAASEADAILRATQESLGPLIDDLPTQRAVTFLVALVVASRNQHPAWALQSQFGIEPHPDGLCVAARIHVGVSGISCRALEETLRIYLESAAAHEAALLAPDPWSAWRRLDGSAFCEIARIFFWRLLALHVNECAAAELGSSIVETERSATDLHTWEMSKIAQPFSARWFNKCAVGQVPDAGSIRWYLGHCLGKLDLELERGISDYVEPQGNPWRRRRAPEPALEL